MCLCLQKRNNKSTSRVWKHDDFSSPVLLPAIYDPVKASQVFHTPPQLMAGWQSPSLILFPDDSISSLVDTIFLMLVNIFTV